ncbi:hypothetical protein [Clostridium sp.]
MTILFYLAVSLPLILVIALILYNISRLKNSRDNALKKRDNLKK